MVRHFDNWGKGDSPRKQRLQKNKIRNQIWRFNIKTVFRRKKSPIDIETFDFETLNDKLFILNLEMQKGKPSTLLSIRSMLARRFRLRAIWTLLEVLNLILLLACLCRC